MSATYQTIVVDGMYGRRAEGRLDTIASPGMNIQMASDGDFDPSSGPGIQVVMEDGLRGKTVTGAYAVDDVVFFYEPLPGDRFQVLVKDGEVITKGDQLYPEKGNTGLWVETPEVATVAQATNITTGVTLKSLEGVITTQAASNAAAAEVSFTVTNPLVEAGDSVVACVGTYGGTGTPLAYVSAVAAGSYVVTITNLHAATALNDVMTINVAIVNKRSRRKFVAEEAKSPSGANDLCLVRAL